MFCGFVPRSSFPSVFDLRCSFFCLFVHSAFECNSKESTQEIAPQKEEKKTNKNRFICVFNRKTRNCDVGFFTPFLYLGTQWNGTVNAKRPKQHHKRATHSKHENGRNLHTTAIFVRCAIMIRLG